VPAALDPDLDVGMWIRLSLIVLCEDTIRLAGQYVVMVAEVIEECV